MAEKNIVLGGDYNGCYIFLKGNLKVKDSLKELGLCIGTDPSKGRFLANTFEKESDFVELNKETVESMELATEDNVKSLSSSLARGLVGAVLLGPLGLVAGGITGKSKKTYQIIIHFKDGKKSLIAADEFTYKKIVKNVF